MARRSGRWLSLSILASVGALWAVDQLLLPSFQAMPGKNQPGNEPFWAQELLSESDRARLSVKALRKQLGASKSPEEMAGFRLSIDEQLALIKPPIDPKEKRENLLALVALAAKSSQIEEGFTRLLTQDLKAKTPIDPVLVTFLTWLKRVGIGGEGSSKGYLQRLANQVEKELPGRGQQLRFLADRPKELAQPYASELHLIFDGTPLPAPKWEVSDARFTQKLRLSHSNASHQKVSERLEWSLDGKSGWKIQPQRQTLALNPSANVEFDVLFDAAAGGPFPYPTLDSILQIEGREMPKRRVALNIDCRKYLFKRPLKAFLLSTKPPIDADWTKAPWSSLTSQSMMLAGDGQGPAKTQTELRLAYDLEGLYVMARMAEPEIAKLVTMGQVRDADLQRDDSVRVTLLVGKKRKTAFQFAINAAGTQWDARNGDATWDRDWSGRVGKSASAWTLVMAIPWLAMEMSKPEPGTSVGIQIMRWRPHGKTETSCWVPGGGKVTEESSYGKVFFQAP